MSFQQTDPQLSHLTVLRAWRIMPGELIAYGVLPWMLAGAVLMLTTRLGYGWLGILCAPLIVLATTPALAWHIDARMRDPIASNTRPFSANHLYTLGAALLVMLITMFVSAGFVIGERPMSISLSGLFVALGVILIHQGDGITFFARLLTADIDMACDYTRVAKQAMPYLLVPIYVAFYLLNMVLATVSPWLSNLLFSVAAANLVVTYVLIVNGLVNDPPPQRTSK